MFDKNPFRDHIEEQSRWKRELTGRALADADSARKFSYSPGSIETRKPVGPKGFSKRTGKHLSSDAERRMGNIIQQNPGMRGVRGRPDFHTMSIEQLADHHYDHYARDGEYGGSLHGELDEVEKHIADTHGKKVLDLIQQRSASALDHDQTYDEDSAASHTDAVNRLKEMGHDVSDHIKKYQFDEQATYTNNWTQVIRQLMAESHTRQELMKLSNAELKKLHGEYMDKGDDDSKKEANMIKEILDDRGDDKEEVNEMKKVVKRVKGAVEKAKGVVKGVVKGAERTAEKVGKAMIQDRGAAGLYGGPNDPTKP